MLVRSGVARSFGPSAKELARYKQHDFIRFLNQKTQRILLVGESALAGFPLELESRFTKVPKFSIRMPHFKGTAAEAKADNISAACRYFCVTSHPDRHVVEAHHPTKPKFVLILLFIPDTLYIYIHVCVLYYIVVCACMCV